MSYKIGSIYQDHEGDIFMIVKVVQGIPKRIRYLFRNDGLPLTQEFSFQVMMDDGLGGEKPFIIRNFQ